MMIQSPKLLYVTCFSHLLGDIVSKISSYHVNLHDFLTKTNDFFSRTQKIPFEFAKHTPPKIILTRWGSFLTVCQFYKKHYFFIEKYILSDKFQKSSQRNKDLYELIMQNNFLDEFSKISESYGHFFRILKKSEARNFSILNIYETF